MDKGEYCCRVQNEYGVLEKNIVLDVEEKTDENDEHKKELEIKRGLQGIFRRQMKLYSAIAR